MLNVAVVRFPGSNCDFDTLRAAESVGASAYFVWHRETDLRQADVVILPGGFSYGDYLRSGAIARFSPVMQAVQRHGAEGGLVLGICNGFQILCEAHLLPGALMRNAGLHFVSKPVDVTVERNDTPFTLDYAVGQRLRLPVAHGDGRFLASADTLRMLEAEGRVVLRYVADTEGSPYQRRCPADDHRKTQPQRGRVLRPAERGAAAEAAREARSQRARGGAQDSLHEVPQGRLRPEQR